MDYGYQNKLVKKPGDPTDLTEEEAEEFINCANDIYYFLEKYVKAQHPDLGSVNFVPRDYQREMIDIVLNNNWSIFNAPRQTGKATYIKEKIATPDGFKEMKDIQVGDVVLGADGKPTNVTMATPIMYNHNCYRLSLSTGESIICDEDHVWEVIYEDHHAGRPTRIFTTKDLLDRKLQTGNKGQCWYSIKTAKPLELPERDLKIPPYIMGVWLGDGSSQHGIITVGHEDIEETYQNICEQWDEENLSVKSYINSQGNGGGNRLAIKKMLGLLKEYGVYKNKHIPKDYLWASYDQRLELLKGLMDTDGSADKRGRCELSFSNKRLVDDTKQLLASLNIKTTVKEHPTPCKMSYRMAFSVFKDDIEVFKLKRKLERQAQSPHKSRINSTNKRHIVSIEPVESVPVKCIQVDNEDHLYLVGESFIPTHNSQTMVSVLLWYAIFHRNLNIGIGSNKLSSGKDIMSRLRYSYEELPFFLKPAVKSYNVFNIIFDNNSSIITEATTENLFRGKSLGLLYLDELAHIPYKTAENMWASLLPSLTSSGSESKTKLVVTSTPSGTEGLYARLAMSANLGENGFKYYKVDHTKVPGRDETFKKRMLTQMSLNDYLTEYEGAFLSSKPTLVSSMILESIKTAEPVAVYRDMNVFRPVKDAVLAFGVDVGTGTGQDYHAIQVWDVNNLEQVAEYKNNTLSQNYFVQELAHFLSYFFKQGAKEIYYGIENNGVSLGVINLIQESELDIFTEAQMVTTFKSKMPGISTTHKSKMNGLMRFKDIMERYACTVYSKQLLTELKFFVNTGQTFKAEPGMHDDLVMSCCILMNTLEEVAYMEDTLNDKWNALDYEEDEPPMIVV